MICTETETVRKPDHHGGKDHGGGVERSPVVSVMLLVALVYSSRCVVRAPCLLFIENPHRQRGRL